MKTKIKITPGTCQFCGCTELNACHLGYGACAWVNRGRTVCSNPSCIRKAQKQGIRLEAGI
jgi:hypothetical protein